MLGFINEIARNIAHYSGHATMVLAFIELALLVFIIIYAVRWRRFTRKWQMLMAGGDSKTLETVLYEQLRSMMRIEEDLQELKQTAKRLDQQLLLCVQNVGIVRFNAFEDVGGEQSFSLALLDGKGDGAVISTIYGRMEARVYVKPIKENSSGNDAPNLTEEERKAIAAAGRRN